MTQQQQQYDISTFANFPFIDTIRRDIAAAGYEKPTPVQAACIPPALEGRDVIGLAPTGTGKTAAFALPIIQRAAGSLEMRALVLAPTRELAQQTAKFFAELGRSSDVRTAVVVGGISIEKDYKALRLWPNVLVATPGRLIDHIESGTVVLKEIQTLVIDEADRMHDMGFIPQIRRILAALPKERQTMMFTATLPPDVEAITKREMRDPLQVQIGRRSMPTEQAEQRLIQVSEEEKTALLLDLLRQDDGRVLIFVRTKRGVDRLARSVSRKHNVTRLHSDRSQNERDAAMAGFREGKYRIMIATDIAARGLDVQEIEHVINYDFPHSAEDYVHRIGRTARAAATGRATSFVTRADHRHVSSLERLLGAKLHLRLSPFGPAAEPQREKPARQRRSRGGRRRRKEAASS